MLTRSHVEALSQIHIHIHVCHMMMKYACNRLVWLMTCGETEMISHFQCEMHFKQYTSVFFKLQFLCFFAVLISKL